VLAAHRQGIKEVILPKANEVDLDDIPEEIREDLNFTLVERLDEVLNKALAPDPKFKMDLNLVGESERADRMPEVAI
jgi:ATP-dependent Lon protease